MKNATDFKMRGANWSERRARGEVVLSLESVHWEEKQEEKKARVRRQERT